MKRPICMVCRRPTRNTDDRSVPVDMRGSISALINGRRVLGHTRCFHQHLADLRRRGEPIVYGARGLPASTRFPNLGAPMHISPLAFADIIRALADSELAARVVDLSDAKIAKLARFAPVEILAEVLVGEDEPPPKPPPAPKPARRAAPARVKPKAAKPKRAKRPRPSPAARRAAALPKPKRIRDTGVPAKVLALLDKGEVDAAAVVRAFPEVKPSTASQILRRLVKQGKAESAGRGRFKSVGVGLTPPAKPVRGADEEE